MNKIHLPPAEKTELALLSPERAQKLDLLIHLVTNLTESLVVCGPAGIGKTTLLEELKKCDKGILPIFSIKVSPSLNFEEFQEQLAKLLLKKLNLNVENKNISNVLTELSRKNRSVVIIIDNAGQLVAGLMGRLIDYASINLGLRLIFALNRDELYVIKEFDHRVDECHFIDLPALTEEQCGSFLRELSSHSSSSLSTENINNQLIEKIYAKTHGIPGKIISEVTNGEAPTTTQWESVERYKWFGLAAIIAIFGSFFIFKGSTPPEIKEVPNLPFVADKFEAIELKPRLKLKEFEEKNAQSQKLGSKNYFDTNSASGNRGQTLSANSDQYVAKVKKKPNTEKLASKLKTAVSTPVPAKVKIEKKIKSLTAKSDNSDWILKQPKGYYTIQIAVLSKQDAVSNLLKKHPSLTSGLKFFRKGNQYVVLYGSFKDAAAASLEANTLPVQYRKSWVRSFSGLQKTIKK